MDASLTQSGDIAQKSFGAQPQLATSGGTLIPLAPGQDGELNNQYVPQRTRLDIDVAAVTHGDLAADRSERRVEFWPQPEGQVAGAVKGRG